jgi:serine phosphatase RsbU (regulator of sigma subunit)
MNRVLTFAIFFVLISTGLLFAQSPKKAFKSLKKGDLDKAKEIFDEIIAENKDMADMTAAYYGLSKIYSTKEYSAFSNDKAYEMIKKALDLHKTLEEGQVNDLAKSEITYNSMFMQRLLIESAFVNNAKAENTVESMNDVIKKLPNADNIKDAVKRRDQLAFNKAVIKNSEEAITEFIKKYPKADQTEDAKKIQARLIFEKVRAKNNVEAFQEFIDQYPNSEQLSEAITLRNQLAYIGMLEKSKEIQAISIEKNKAEIKNRTNQRNNFIIGMILLVLLVFVTLFGLIKRTKANRILAIQKKEIEEKNSFLENANQEINRQKNIILARSKEITDSINYAKKIQEAILRIDEEMEKLLPQSFILFKPKDIVSGDFYWISEKDNKVLITAADCTGHGVPGGFMSLICTSILNEVVMEKGIIKTNVILDEVRKGIIKSLNQRGNPGEQKDGMDAALCSYDKEKNILSFSGANNPLYLIRKGNEPLKYFNGTEAKPDIIDQDHVLFHIRPDKQPIGYHGGKEHPFTEHLVQLNKGDSLYLFSDGYVDQFGGIKGKKFKSKQLKYLLLSIQDNNIEDQKYILDKTIEDWRGDHEQIDDICIVGFRV